MFFFKPLFYYVLLLQLKVIFETRHGGKCLKLCYFLNGRLDGTVNAGALSTCKNRLNMLEHNVFREVLHPEKLVNDVNVLHSINLHSSSIMFFCF